MCALALRLGAAAPGMPAANGSVVGDAPAAWPPSARPISAQAAAAGSSRPADLKARFVSVLNVGGGGGGNKTAPALHGRAAEALPSAGAFERACAAWPPAAAPRAPAARPARAQPAQFGPTCPAGLEARFASVPKVDGSDVAAAPQPPQSARALAADLGAGLGFRARSTGADGPGGAGSAAAEPQGGAVPHVLQQAPNANSDAAGLSGLLGSVSLGGAASGANHTHPDSSVGLAGRLAGQLAGVSLGGATASPRPGTASAAGSGPASSPNRMNPVTRTQASLAARFAAAASLGDTAEHGRAPAAAPHGGVPAEGLGLESGSANMAQRFAGTATLDDQPAGAGEAGQPAAAQGLGAGFVFSAQGARPLCQHAG